MQTYLRRPFNKRMSPRLKMKLLKTIIQGVARFHKNYYLKQSDNDITFEYL